MNKANQVFDGVGDAYPAWRLRMMVKLQEKNYWEKVNVEPQPDSLKYIKYQRKAMAIIMPYMSNSVITFVQPQDTSVKEIFEKLDREYIKKGSHEQMRIKRQVESLRFKIGDDLDKYLREFIELCDKYDNAAVVKEEIFHEHSRVDSLLLSMPEGKLADVLGRDEPRKMHLVTSRLREEYGIIMLRKERDGEVEKKTEGKSDLNNAVLYASRKRPLINNFRGQRRNVSVKPEFDQSRPRMRCHFCKKEGHMKRDCYKLKGRRPGKQFKRTVNAVGATDHAEPDVARSSEGYVLMAGKSLNDVNFDGICFVLDSGSSEHIVNCPTIADNFEELEVPIRLSVAKGNQFIMATKRGTLQLYSDSPDNTMIVEDVLYVEDATMNLLSVTKLAKTGISTIFDKSGAMLSTSGKTIARGEFIGDLIGIRMRLLIERSSLLVGNTATDYNLWHRRLGHMCKDKFVQLKNKAMCSDVKLIENINPSKCMCEPCLMGRMTRKPFNKKKEDKISRPLFEIHSDVGGPLTPSNLHHYRYFVVFIDKYTHYCVTYAMRHKSEVVSHFKDYVEKAETHFNSRVANIYCDNGGEYTSDEMHAYCSKKGIQCHFTTPHTPQLNGISERMMRTIGEKHRTLLCDSKLKGHFWADAVLTATYLINRIPTAAVPNNKTPFELWHMKKPNLKYLRIFGCKAYVFG